jgi:hypothetical protein
MMIFVIDVPNESLIGELFKLLAINVFIAVVSTAIELSFNADPAPPVTVINEPAVVFFL